MDGSHRREGLQPDQTALILFDGVCKLCNALVLFVIDRDPRGYFRFAALQSRAGQDVLQAFGLPRADLDTFVLVERGRVYLRSAAALRTLRRLKGGSALLWPLIWLPVSLRDAVYRYIARRRYGWFGTVPACRLPTPDIQDRFLE